MSPNELAATNAGERLQFRCAVHVSWPGVAELFTFGIVRVAMRFTPFIFVLALLAGCSRDDARLQGTWRSNRDATVAAAFQRDSRWTNATTEKVERFRDMFGHMTITYSKGTITSDYRGDVSSFPYRILGSGSNFVVIRSDAPLDKDRDIRIRFVDSDSAYWIDTGPLGNGLEERFDNVKK
jgi:hypothetical protein